MSSGYTKLFSDIVDSSIWNEKAETCKVWVTLLALSNADGYVRGSIGWLAGKSKVTKAECAEAIAKFSEPDQHSRTPDNDGKRIEVLSDGWLILNYLLFRDRLSNDPKVSATRERVRKHRERYIALRNAESVTCDHSASASASASEPVPLNTDNGHSKPPAPVKKKPELPELELYATKIGLHPDEIGKFQDYYEANGWRVGKNPMKSWEAAMRNWKRNVDQRKYEPSVAANGKRALTPLDIRTIIQAKREQAATLKNRHCSETAMDSIWNCDDSRGQYFQLMREVKELNQKLGAYQ